MRYHHRLIVELFKKKTLKHSHSEFGLVPEMVWQKPRLQKEQQNSSKPIRGATHSICILSIISIGSRIAVAWFLSSICFSCRSSRTTELTMSVEVVFGLFLFRREKKASSEKRHLEEEEPVLLRRSVCGNSRGNYVLWQRHWRNFSGVRRW